MKPALTAGAFAPANDNAPSLWKAITDHSRLVDEERQTELRREHIIRRAQAFTWTVPANDNQAWPLLQSLRKDGNASLVPVAERYRALWEKANLEPLKGTDPEADIFRIVMKPANKADPDGRTKGVLVTSHAAGIRTGGKRSRLQASEKIRDDAGPNPTRPGTARTKTWRGEDIMASWIDANRDLDRLRCALGAVTEAFEEAVCYGATLTEIGRSRGAGQSAPGAGKLLVMLGLEVVQAEFARMDRDRKRCA
jgi:hypothetical protein